MPFSRNNFSVQKKAEQTKEILGFTDSDVIKEENHPFPVKPITSPQLVAEAEDGDSWPSSHPLIAGLLLCSNKAISANLLHFNSVNSSMQLGVDTKTRFHEAVIVAQIPVISQFPGVKTHVSLSNTGWTEGWRIP